MSGILQIPVVRGLAVFTAPRAVGVSVVGLLAGQFDWERGIEQCGLNLLPSICHCFVVRLVIVSIQFKTAPTGRWGGLHRSPLAEATEALQYHPT